MKVCVVNYSGNVGKSTLAAHLLHPRMKAPVISVESLNMDASGDGVDVERIQAARFRELQARFMELDNVIVDVGASNIELFLKLLQQFEGSQDEFDWFVVPVVKETKQQSDTINTIRSLRALGIEAEKIRVVINKVEPDEDLGYAFGAVQAFCDQGHANMPSRAVVYDNEIFKQLKLTNTSIPSILEDTTDYVKIRKEAKSPQEKHDAIEKTINQRLARGCTKNLDEAYAALFA